MGRGVTKFPDNFEVGGCGNKKFVQLEFPWLDAQISPRARENGISSYKL